MALTSETIHELVTAIPLFSRIDEGMLGGILANSKVVEPDKGEVLFVQGDSAEFLYVMLSGWVKLFRETGEGNEAITALCTHGDLFGEAVLYQGSHYPFGAQAVEDAIVLRVPAQTIRKQVDENRNFSASLMKAISQRLQALELHTEHLEVMTATQRVGCYLLKLCYAKKEEQTKLLLPYDKTLIARYLGMKLETFSRALAKLKEVGITVDGPEIIVADIGELQAHVCGNCSLEPGGCKSDESDT